MVAQWVKDMTEATMGPCSMKVGEIIDHPNGYKVKVTSGRYWGTHGVSNFWYWRKVFPDGGLGKEECGYGW